MALPFNGDFLLLETSLDEKPEGKAASHLQVTNCFSCISSRSPERGCLVPDGNMHRMAPALIWGDLMGGLCYLDHHVAPGQPSLPPQPGETALSLPSTAHTAGTTLSPPFILAKAGSRHREATQAGPKHTVDLVPVN